MIAVYAPDDGDRFVFDRAASPPLLRFETQSRDLGAAAPARSARRHHLQERPGRADAAGHAPGRPDPVHHGRAGRHGGGDAGRGPADPAASILTAGALLQHLAQASAHTSHALQRLVVFDAPDVTPESAYLIADAAGGRRRGDRRVAQEDAARP